MNENKKNHAPQNHSEIQRHKMQPNGQTDTIEVEGDSDGFYVFITNRLIL